MGYPRAALRTGTLRVVAAAERVYAPSANEVFAITDNSVLHRLGGPPCSPLRWQAWSLERTGAAGLLIDGVYAADGRT